jgi:hypothetical protein
VSVFKTAVVTCPAVPVQVEGELADGRWYFFRYRHGVAGLGIGATEEEACCREGRTNRVMGADLDGWMDATQVATALLCLLTDRAHEDHGLIPLLVSFDLAALVALVQAAMDAYDLAEAQGG